VKAARAAASGDLPPEQVRALSTHYRTALPGCGHSWPGVTLPGVYTASNADSITMGSSTAPPNFTISYLPLPAPPALSEERQETPMADKPKATPEPSGDLGTLQAFHRSIHAALLDAGCVIEDGKEPASLIRGLGAELVELRLLKEQVETLRGQVDDLKPQAEDGKAYRSDLVDQTWAEYARAGRAEGKDEAKTKARWHRLPLDELKESLAEYTESARERCKPGRQTTEGDPPPERLNGFVTPPTPARAFRA
jgi:hypothetical protein